MGYSKAEDEFFDQRYYRLTKVLTWHNGQWPLQPNKQKVVRTILTVIGVASTFIPVTIKLTELLGDVDGMLECFIPLGVMVCVYLRLSNGIILCHKMVAMLRIIKEDWESLTDKDEIKIFAYHTERGRKFTFYYVCYMYSSMVLYILLPLTPMAADFINPLNESRPRKFLINAEYYIDSYAHFYLVSLHHCLTINLGITIVLATDMLYVMYTYHVCAQFAVLGYRLKTASLVEYAEWQERAVEDETYKDGFVHTDSNESKAHADLVICVKKHRKAIEFINLLESGFSYSIVVQLGVHVILISVTGIQVLAHGDNMDDVIRYGSLCIAQFIHLFIMIYPGQVLMNCSTDVFYEAYNSPWYVFSEHSKKLFDFILMKSRIPCLLTGGKVCILNMETFLSITQTVMSYFTVLTSMR